VRRVRQTTLSLIEKQFRLGDWIDRHMTVELKSGPEWVCECPVCGRDKLAVHVGRKAFQCLSASCQFRSWRPRYLVAAQLGVRPDVADEVIAAFGIGRQLGPVSALTMPDPGYRLPHKLPGAALPRVGWNQLGPAQQRYLDQRGVPRSHQLWLGLSTIVSDHTLSKADRVLTGRVMFPIWNPSGRVVFWAARATGDHPAKVVNMPRACREDHGPWCVCYHEAWGLPGVPQAAEAHEVVVGLHWIQRDAPVVIVEGPMDVAVCGPQFVGALGAHLTEPQAALIASAGPSEAIILFDGDRGGREAAPKAERIMSAYLPTRSLCCPEGTDPGSLGRDRALTLALAAPFQGALGALGAFGSASPSPKTTMKPPFLRKLEQS
jgi:hypothetical protein